MVHNSEKERMENEKSNTGYEKMTGDTVINRGYEIHDEWEEKGYSSRRIVACTVGAAARLAEKRTSARSLEALAYLFALDMRIGKRYGSFWRCIFLYLSWRRERRALATLKDALNIPSGMKDTRTAIEAELEKLREKTESEEEDVDDDEKSGGGKRNNKSTEKDAKSAENGKDTPKEEGAEEIPDSEETEKTAEEKTEETYERSQDEQKTEKVGEPKAEEGREADVETTGNEDKTEVKEKPAEQKEESNGIDEKVEPSNDKVKENGAQGNTVDMPPNDGAFILESRSEKNAAAKESFIDEVITYNIMRGEKDILMNNPFGDGSRDGTDAERAAQTPETREERNSEKLTRLEDEMAAIERVNETAPKETKAENSNQKTDTAPKNERVDDKRVQIQVDMTEKLENEMRGDLNNHLSKEMVLTIKAGLEQAAREQLTIASKELGIDAPVEIIGKTEMKEIERGIAAPNKE